MPVVVFIALLVSLFAVPAQAEEQTGKPWLGVSMTAAPGGGVAVEFVFRSSPADKAGLETDDVMLSLDGVMVDQPADVVAHVGRRRPGMTLHVVLRRGGRERKVGVELARHPGSDQVARLMHIGNKAHDLVNADAVQGAVPPTMNELRDKVVIVDFFASWCASCRTLAPKLAAWHGRFEKRGLRVIGITSDTRKVSEETVKQWNIPFAVGSDIGERTNTAYRVFAIPAVFLIDRKGIIRDVMIGYDPSRLAAFEKNIEALVSER
jgi:peroxiredoxin